MATDKLKHIEAFFHSQKVKGYATYLTFTYERNFIYIYDSINTGIKAGDFSIIYMSPETLFNSDLWGDMILNSEVYKERVCLIAIDEAHILESW